MNQKKQKCPLSLVGQREITVLDDGRIKLPTDVLRTLRSAEPSSSGLYPGRIPLTKALVLCPEPLWDRWKGDLQSQFPALKTHPGAAAYLNPFKPVKWDRQGRLSLPAEAHDLAGISGSLTVVLVGRDYYLQIWAKKEFDKAVAECDATLLELDRRPSAEDREEDTRSRPRGDGIL